MATLNTRMTQLVDTTNNWKSATEAPKKGEIVIYQEDGSKESKIKVGDGNTSVEELPFVAGEIDEQLNSNSTNAVTNKVITEQFNIIADEIKDYKTTYVCTSNIDPSNYSTLSTENFYYVSTGITNGVKLTKYKKNYLPTTRKSGSTFIKVNGDAKLEGWCQEDGTIVLNGEVPINSNTGPIEYCAKTALEEPLPSGTYILCWPNTMGTIYLQPFLCLYTEDEKLIVADTINGNERKTGSYEFGSTLAWGGGYGYIAKYYRDGYNSIEFSITESAYYIQLIFRGYCSKNATNNNKFNTFHFYPMLVNADESMKEITVNKDLQEVQKEYVLFNDNEICDNNGALMTLELRNPVNVTYPLSLGGQIAALKSTMIDLHKK